MKKLSLIFLFLLSASAMAADIVVYGPGGPAPVMKELAVQFQNKTNNKVEVVAGPTPKWINNAKENADIIYSGNSSMMDAFIKLLPDQLNHTDVEVLNIREAGIVVRPDNPKNIKTFNDLLKKNVKVMVVDGAGQVGLYEDVALRDGKQENLARLRKNIVFYAPNSKMAVDRWSSDKEIDALIIWSHWANSIGKDKAKFVTLSPVNVIYRASEIAITKNSKNRKVAEEFIDFVQSKEAQEVWKKWGWVEK